MIEKKISKFILVLLLALVIAWIFLNPYTDLNTLNTKGYIVTNINNFFSSVGVGYRFVLSDIYVIIRFVEYFALGIMFSAVTGIYTKNFFKHLTVPLFFGLLVAVGEIYSKYLNNVFVPVPIIPISFVEFIFGMILYIGIISLRTSSGRTLKYNSKKYARRR